ICTRSLHDALPISSAHHERAGGPVEEIPYNQIPVRRGRGARFNPANRFEPLHLEEDPAALDEEELRQVETTYFVDHTKSVLARNDSPDTGFTVSINP